MIVPSVLTNLYKVLCPRIKRSSLSKIHRIIFSQRNLHRKYNPFSDYHKKLKTKVSSYVLYINLVGILIQTICVPRETEPFNLHLRLSKALMIKHLKEKKYFTILLSCACLAIGWFLKVDFFRCLRTYAMNVYSLSFL